LDYFFGYVDTMARQTPQDLTAYASKYIVGHPHVIGVLLSSEARAALNLTPSSLRELGAQP
jgi:predicted Zn-dependent peptidase